MTNGARRIPLAAGDGGSVVSDRIYSPRSSAMFFRYNRCKQCLVAFKKKKTWPKKIAATPTYVKSSSESLESSRKYYDHCSLNSSNHVRKNYFLSEKPHILNLSELYQNLHKYADLKGKPRCVCFFFFFWGGGGGGGGHTRTESDRAHALSQNHHFLHSERFIA